MGTVELVVLSAALGTDLFSVSVPIGMSKIKMRTILTAAVTFAVFHIVLILSGYFAGHWLGLAVEHLSSDHLAHPVLVVQNWAGVLGAVILCALGLFMIKENLSGRHGTVGSHMLKGSKLMALAFSVSVDALAAGFSMGMMDVNLIKLSIILGAVIFLIAVVGLSLGRRLARYIGTRAQLAGGLILVMLSLHVLWRIVG